MLRSIGAGVLLLLGGLGGAQDFASELPRGIGTLSGLELVAGTFETPALSAAFRFYVRPERPVLYEVMRYRLRRAGGDGDAEPPLPTEKLVWYEHPGRREPLRCFERLEPVASAGPPRWREMASGTAEYDAEMRTLIAVLGLHQTGIVPPADSPR